MHKETNKSNALTIVIDDEHIGFKDADLDASNCSKLKFESKLLVCCNESRYCLNKYEDGNRKYSIS